MKTKEDCAYCGTPLSKDGVYRNGKYFCWEGHAEEYEKDDGKFVAELLAAPSPGSHWITAYPDQIRMEAIKIAVAIGTGNDSGTIIANAKIIEKYLRTGD